MPLDDVFLVALYPTTTTKQHWLRQWVLSYPLATEVAVDGTAAGDVAQIAQVLDSIHDESVVVAYDLACLSFCQWLYEADILAQKRIRGVILAAPNEALWQQYDADAAINRVRFTFPTAWVSTATDPLCSQTWSRQQAKRLGARYLMAPGHGHLAETPKHWSFGVQLLQEMLWGVK